MTFADDIAEIINEVGGDSTDTTLTTKMFGFYKAGARHIPPYVRDRNFITVGEYTLPSATNTVALSNFPGFIRPLEVWFKETGQGQIHVLVYKIPALQYFHKIITPLYSRKPFYYHIYGQTLQFDGLAPAGLIIGMEYVHEISSILITDTIVWHEQLREAMKHFCKAQYYRYEEDRDIARDEERLGKEIISGLEEEYEVEELGGFVDEKF